MYRLVVVWQKGTYFEVMGGVVSERYKGLGSWFSWGVCYMRETVVDFA